MNRIVHESILADRDRNLRRWKALREQAVGGEQRTIGVARAVAGRVQEIECIELHAPTVGEPITHIAIYGVQWRRLEDAVLGERPRADIAPAQRAKPASFFAQRDARRCHHPWSLGDEIAGGIADLRLRKAGKRLEELLLRQVKADKPGARQSKIGIDADP